MKYYGLKFYYGKNCWKLSKYKYWDKSRERYHYHPRQRWFSKF